MERLSALNRTLRIYLIIGVAVCLVSWIATLAFYLTDIVSAGPVYFIWQFVYYGAPALCGVLVASWIVTRLWVRTQAVAAGPSVPDDQLSADNPVPVDGSADGHSI